MDDLPRCEEAPPRAVDFAPRAIRQAGRHGPVVAGVWAAGLALLVGVGALTGGPAVEAPDGGLPRVAEEDQSDPNRPDSSLPSTRMGALLLGAAIELDDPAPARVEIRTARLAVAGSMLVHAARVEIALEARGNRVLDSVSVDVSDPDGGVRPVRALTFRASFDLPYPRPNGTMWVVVTAFDDGEMPLGATRQPFIVGPLVESQLALADSQPMSERWRPQPSQPPQQGPTPGAFPPTCIPVSPSLASSC